MSPYPVAPKTGEPTVNVAESQTEYAPIVCAIRERPEGMALVQRWRFRREEIEALANGADLWIEVLTFGGPLQPMSLYVAASPLREPDA